MKKLIIISILAALVTAVMAQNYPDEYLGLPGDNLNLYAVMKLFQESETLEGFERSLNDENSRINNLDLNSDNLTDYINVVDYVDGDVHTIVLRAILDRNETQDVAVFTVQRFRDGSVQIQLVGDEDLYGKDYIIEPIYDDNYAETPNPGYAGRPGNRVNITIVRTTPVEIAYWPLVRFIFMPDYVIWRSSWYWGYYPPYWHPWRPFFWHYYYGYHYHWHPHYYAHYHLWHQHRYTRYNDFYYTGIRSHSPVVENRIKEGTYKLTYSHPEQRKDGEALYSRTYTGRDSGKSETARPSDRNSGTTGRRAMPSAGKPVTKSSSGQNTGDSRRSSPAVSGRSVYRSESGQRAESSRTSRSTTKSAGSSGKSSSKESGSRRVSKKSGISKDSKSSNSTRRR